MPYGLNKYGLPEYTPPKYALPEFGATNPATGGDGTPSESDPAIVSYWKLDEGTGTTSADAVGSYPLTADGATIWASGGAFDYVGDNSFSPLGTTGRMITGTTVPDLNFDSTDPFTVYAWVKFPLPLPASNDQYSHYSRVRIASPVGVYLSTFFDATGSKRQLNFDMFAQNSGLKYIRVFTDGLGTDFMDGDWHMLAWTKSASLLSSGVEMYIDGVQQGKDAPVSDTLLSGAAIPATGDAWESGCLGARVDDNYGQLEGSQDNTIVYNDVRTPAEILADYNAWQASL